MRTSVRMQHQFHQDRKKINCTQIRPQINVTERLRMCKGVLTLRNITF